MKESRPVSKHWQRGKGEGKRRKESFLSITRRLKSRKLENIGLVTEENKILRREW